MKNLFFFLLLLFVCAVVPHTVSAESDDIEMTDSTSTQWDGVIGGGLTPSTPKGPVTSITISQTTAALEGGDTLQIVAMVNSDAANKSIYWTSSNTEVATVNTSGLVSALHIGTATITATAVDNNSVAASCIVTVISDAPNESIAEIVCGDRQAGLNTAIDLLGRYVKNIERGFYFLNDKIVFIK